MKLNIIRHLKIASVLLASLLYLSSCTKVETIDVDAVPQASLLQRDMKKWAEERELQKQQDESDQAFLNRVKEMYDAYYAALRAYKKSDHKVVYGWFLAGPPRLV